jgi:hypothetical protein
MPIQWVLRWIVRQCMFACLRKYVFNTQCRCNTAGYDFMCEIYTIGHVCDLQPCTNFQTCVPLSNTTYQCMCVFGYMGAMCTQCMSFTHLLTHILTHSNFADNLTAERPNTRITVSFIATMDKQWMTDITYTINATTTSNVINCAELCVQYYWCTSMSYGVGGACKLMAIVTSISNASLLTMASNYRVFDIQYITNQ